MLPNFTQREIRQAAARAASTLSTAGETLADLYAFMPAKPGCGGTTIATYATAMAAQLSAEPTLLLDFDIRLGVTSFLLKAEGAHTIVDALLQSDRLDVDIWSSLVVQLKNLHLLGSGPMDFSRHVSTERYMELLDFALRRYSLVAVDLPGTMEDQECETLLRAKKIYLVCTPDIGALHVARRKANWLQDLRLTDKVSVVLNCMERRSTLSVDDIQRIIQLPVRHLLPASAGEISRAVQKGAVLDTGSGLGKQIARIAEEMASNRPAIKKPGAVRRFVEYFSISAARDATLNSIPARRSIMTNQTILSLLNYLCNEARNSVQASFGLMALGPNLSPDPAWQACLENSKCGADRLLRCIDDIRELLSTGNAGVRSGRGVRFDAVLGETIELLNLASGDRASRLILQAAGAAGHRTAASAGRRAGAHAHSGRRLQTRAQGRCTGLGGRAMDGDGVQFEIIPANSNIALRVADWLNADPDQSRLPGRRRSAARASPRWWPGSAFAPWEGVPNS